MTSISTSGQFFRIQTQNLAIQARMTEYSEQSSTGKKGTVYGALGSDVRQSIDLRGNVDELDTYQKNIATAQLRVTSAVETMDRIKNVARDVRDQLTKLSGNPPPDQTVVKDIAQARLQRSGAASQHEGRRPLYLRRQRHRQRAVSQCRPVLHRRPDGSERLCRQRRAGDPGRDHGHRHRRHIFLDGASGGRSVPADGAGRPQPRHHLSGPGERAGAADAAGRPDRAVPRDPAQPRHRGQPDLRHEQPGLVRRFPDDAEHHAHQPRQRRQDSSTTMSASSAPTPPG